MVNQSVKELITKDFPDIDDYDYICVGDLNHYRVMYVKQLLEGENKKIDRDVVDVISSIEERGIISKKVETEIDESRTFGERLSDSLAQFAGSWKFILIFCVVIVTWVLANTVLLFVYRFDPYPFILLNLILSCVAALQAPIIMMSQNRQEDRDRIRSISDYKLNLKAELEIRLLHDKLDDFIRNNWQKLVEIQEIQLEMISDRDKM